MQDKTPAPRVTVAVFGAAHGVRGELRLKSYTGDPAAFAGYGSLQDTAGKRSFEIKSHRHVRDDLFVVSVAGAADRTAAEALNGIELTLPRSALPAPDEDEFYHADLIGLAVQSPEGERLGRVQAVLNFGAGDILEVATPAGQANLLLPFTKAVVPVIDFAAGVLTAVPPAEVEAKEEQE